MSDGVCANVDFPFPGRLVGDALAIASGIDPIRTHGFPERMVWPLIEVVQAAIEEPWLKLLATHLESGNERRFARLAHLAHLFDEYALRRPELLLCLDARRGPRPTGPATGRPELWLGCESGSACRAAPSVSPRLQRSATSRIS